MSFDYYSSELAKYCKRCSGSKRLIEKDNKEVMCFCQLKALILYRREQIPVELREKEWDDYTGDTIKNDDEYRVINWDIARGASFGYCFKNLPVSSFKKEPELLLVSEEHIKDTLLHRISRSQIPRRLKDGSNIVILGDSFTGKSLLASLIAKEIINASVLLGDFDFKWISFSKVINAMGFDGHHDYQLIDEVACVSFLVLDNVHFPQQNNYMRNVFDGMINDRIVNMLPIIVTGTTAIDNGEYVRTKMGDEFYRLLYNQNTYIINLECNKKCQ